MSSVFRVKIGRAIGLDREGNTGNQEPEYFPRRELRRAGLHFGFKDSENDWGRGGKQQINYGGKLVVYLDNSGHVVDWQSFD